MHRISYGIVLSLVFYSTASCQERMNPVTCFETHRIHCLNLVSNENKVCNDKSCVLGISNGHWVKICAQYEARRTPNLTVARGVPVQGRWALDDQTSNSWTVCTIQELCDCDSNLPLPQPCRTIATQFLSDTTTNEASGEPCFDKKD